MEIYYGYEYRSAGGQPAVGMAGKQFETAGSAQCILLTDVNLVH